MWNVVEVSLLDAFGRTCLRNFFLLGILSNSEFCSRISRPLELSLLLRNSKLSIKTVVSMFPVFQRYPALYSHSSSHSLLGATAAVFCCWTLGSSSGFKYCTLAYLGQPGASFRGWAECCLFTSSTHMFPARLGISCSDLLLPFLLFGQSPSWLDTGSMFGCDCLYNHFSLSSGGCITIHTLVVLFSLITMPSSPQRL